MSTSERKIIQQQVSRSSSKSFRDVTPTQPKNDRSPANPSNQSNQRPLSNSRVNTVPNQRYNFSYAEGNQMRPNASKNNRRNASHYADAEHDESPTNQLQVTPLNINGPEFGSVFRSGPKKGGVINDLLYTNFNYHEEYHDNRSFNRYDHKLSNKTRTNATSSCFNKEQFLLANCQFVVKSGFDYTAHLADPDLLVDWNYIEEVRLLQNELPTCPICLSAPVAAQITRCGHVYCWPCMLHYLALSDEPWRKCPICFEAIHRQQLRSARFVIPKELCVEQRQVRLTLMRRELGSNYTAPLYIWRRENATILTPIKDKLSHYSKLLISRPKQTKTLVLDREKQELTLKLQEDKYAPENAFVEEAIEALKMRENTLFEIKPANVSILPSLKSSVDSHVVEIFSGKKLLKTDGKIQKNVTRHGKEEKSYFFYQAEDGQPIFLHPINVHCLLRDFGTLDKAPQTIVGKVVQMESFTMCPDIRKRYRYLSHLPLTCVFTLIELDFDPKLNIVSEDTLKFFADEFERRKINRMNKEREEQLQQKRCQRWEQAMLLNSSNFNMDVASTSTSIDDFPISTFVQSAQREIEATFNINSSSPTVFGSPTGPETTKNEECLGTTPSFAQMLRCGKPKTSSSVWPKLGTRMTAENEECAPLALTAYRQEFGDALQAALDNLDADDLAPAPEAKPKKKKKGKILFTL